MDCLYGKCTECSRYNTSFARCQSCYPFKTTLGWTGGNNDVDICIKNFQLKSTMQLEDNEREIYGITQDATNSEYTIVIDEFYHKRDIKYGKCTQCERYNTSQAWCQSCDPFKSTQGWTSGNKDFDDCIKEFQLKSTGYENVIEWIPFNRLSSFQKIRLNFQALWLDGIREVKNNLKSRTLSYSVEIKKFNNLQIDTLEFINEFKNYMKLGNNERKIYGITQDRITSEYMIVFDEFYYKRDIKYGKCTHCERYKTSIAWCQSCDPFKTTQGWTSGNNDIDVFIKEAQLTSTNYEDVIEWIPFNRLSNLQKIGLNFQALWLDGIRNIKNNTRTRLLSHAVELKKINESQINTSELINKIKNYIQFMGNEYKLYGITQDTMTDQYMIVFDEFYYRRSITDGKCKQCERNNTSEAWCLSCDPFKTTQGWTSENKDIDECIKELQLKSTNYENVIEWIPYNMLFNFQKIGESKFLALLINGIRKVKNNSQSRTLTCVIKLKKFNYSQIDTLKFIKKFKMKLRNNESKLYGITRDPTTGQYMIAFDDFYYKRDIIYGKCKHCERYNTSEAWCQSCDLFKTIQGWTSGNNAVDECIKEFQLKTTKYEDFIEWIPFYKLTNLQKIGKLEFKAQWLSGIRIVESRNPLYSKVNTLEFIQSRTLSYAVELQKFNDSQIDALEFIKKDSKLRLYGITQDTTTNQYMIVFDGFHYGREIIYGKCAHCNRYNTSEAWCQSCDPFKVIQGWTSGSKDIDDCIKEFQRKSTRYEDVIEWIPFNRLSNLQKIDESIFHALWLDGARKVKNNTRLRTLSCLVELQKFDGLQVDALEFIRKFKSFVQFENNGHKIFGITQNASSEQYMMVIDYCISRRARKYGVCRWDGHYNTSRGWCQSCDPFEMTQEWTSESIDVDDCIKEFQFMATKYDKVIEWIPFDRLNNIQQIGKGGFGDVFSANWIDGKRKVLNDGKRFIQSRTQSYLVALKTLSGSSSSADFLREDLALKICNGLRPKFASGTPDFYVEFSELCMNFDPQKRPTAEEIFHKLEEWYHLINEFDETEYYYDIQEIDRFEFEEIDESKVEMFNKFLESDEIVKQLPMAAQIHQDSEYTSRFINTNSVSERYWQ
ncbi:1787_t:CDS:2, partial [Acaulospora morrowiae]